MQGHRQLTFLNQARICPMFLSTDFLTIKARDVQCRKSREYKHANENTHTQHTPPPNISTEGELQLQLCSKGIQTIFYICIYACITNILFPKFLFLHMAEYKHPPMSLKIHLPRDFNSAMVFYKQINQSWIVDMGVVSIFPLLEAACCEHMLFT